ncbi:helix-turn-helix domain-containing protein [Thermodesulfitimonas sp.]
MQIERITLTVAEARAYSGLGRNTLLRLVQTGEVQTRRIGKRRWLILRDSLESWLRGKGNTTGGGEDVPKNMEGGCRTHAR